ncbi:hypothetical protein ACFW04_011801 [Cataglyphis niger]
MDYYSMYHDELQNGGSRGGEIPRVFVGSLYQRGVRAVGKKALRAGVNIIDDIVNNMPFKVAVKHRFEESRDKRKSSQSIHYKPVTSLSDDSPIEFVVPGHGEEYLDLTHTMLNLRVRVETSDDSTEHVMGAGGSASADNVGPVNHLLHSIFNQIDVYFNQTLVSPPNNAYRAYIEALLNYSLPTKTSHLASCLWDADTLGRMDEPVESKTANSALIIFEENGHKFLINGVEVRLRLVCSKDSFCLMKSNGSSSKIHILDASLLVRRTKISAGYC